MKLRDPHSSALLEAYRAHTRPSPEAKRRMASVLLDTTKDKPRVWPWIVAGAVAAAAVVLWFVVGLVGGPLRMSAGANPSTASDQAEPNDAVRVATGGRETRASDPVPAPRPPQPARATPTALRPEPVNPRALPAAQARPQPGETRADLEGAAPEDDTVADAWLRIEAAERALAEGKPSVALEELDRHAREFPRADLGQERRALRVLALCAVGRTTEGRGQQGAFLRDFPRSTYRARVERACKP